MQAGSNRAKYLGTAGSDRMGLLKKEQVYPASVMENARKRENRHKELLKVWRTDILSNWNAVYMRQRVKRLVWEGIPSPVRREVWSRLLGNRLNIDLPLFNQCITLSRERLRSSGHCNLIQSGTFKTDSLSETFVPRECSLCSRVLVNLNTTPLKRELSLAYQAGLAATVDTPPIDTSPNAAQILDPTRLRSNCSSSHQSPLQGDRTSSCTHFDRTTSLHAIKLDVSRTFPVLGLFQPGNPLHSPLHDLLAAYVAYRPEIGYVQGMSFLAAILLLVMDNTFEAFVMFANILERPCHRAFYSLDENEFIVHFRAFDETLFACMPGLYLHFKRVGLEPNMYLFDWLFTLFSRSLPLETDMRVWDLFFLDGEVALFRAALGVLHVYEAQLLNSNFDQLATFLTSPLPSDLCADELVRHMRSVQLKKKTFNRRLARIRSNLLDNPLFQNPTCTKAHKRSADSHRQNTSKIATEQHVSSEFTSQSSLEPDALSKWKLIDLPDINPPICSSLSHVDHSVISLCSVSTSSRSSSLDNVTNKERDQSEEKTTLRSHTSSKSKDTRSLEQNRLIARIRLNAKLDEYFNGQQSLPAQERRAHDAKERQRYQRSKRRLEAKLEFKAREGLNQKPEPVDSE
ncbi:TBC1 domain family member 14 [Clonorchis sinensis]|uniref:TBC1 domain family member 14 n=1 Tax=Clonorchis sinensis TaxID=79923 RepID=G7YQF2_CLOSI|nr:TBC1 domain family member 14 [Clonorchis sinensis]